MTAYRQANAQLDDAIAAFTADPSPSRAARIADRSAEAAALTDVPSIRAFLTERAAYWRGTKWMIDNGIDLMR